MNDRVREELKFYGAGTTIFAVFILHMIYTFWTNQGWTFFHRVANATFLPDGATGTKAMVLFAAGVYFGLLFVYSLDHRKRYRGLVLLGGSVIVILGLAGLGIGLPNFGPTPLNIGAFVVGGSLGVLTEYSPVETIIIDDSLRSVDWNDTFSGVGGVHWGPAVERYNDEKIEFDAASRLFQAYNILLVSIVAIANLLLARPNIGVIHLIHLIATGGFVIFLFQFLAIDVRSEPIIDGPDDDDEATDGDSTIEQSQSKNKHTFEVIGPEQSGKTFLSYGLNDDIDSVPELTKKEKSPDMIELYYEVNERIQKCRTEEGYVDWNVVPKTKRENTFKYWVDVEVQGVTSRLGRISHTDYGGENLESIQQRITQTDGGKQPDDEPPEESTDSKSEPTINEEDIDLDDIQAERETQPDLGFGGEDGSETNSNQGNGSKVVYPDTTEPIDAENSDDDDDETEDDNDTEPSSEQDKKSNVELAVEEIMDSIEEADSLLLVIDGKRLKGEAVHGGGSQFVGGEEMETIVTAYQPDKVIPVVTKADAWIEEFQQSEFADFDDDEEIKPPTENNNWAEFRLFMTKVLKNAGETTELMNVLDNPEAFPVYYHSAKVNNETAKKASAKSMTTPDNPESSTTNSNPNPEDDSYQEVAIVDEYNNLQKEGYKTLLKELAKNF